MTRKVKIDYITEVPGGEVFNLYLLEDEPWPLGADEMAAKLDTIREKIENAADVALLGHLARAYPQSSGKVAQVVVASPRFGYPDALVSVIKELCSRLEERAQANEHVRQLRVVTNDEVVAANKLEKQQGE